MTWWQRLWRRQQMEVELDKELQFHIDQYTSQLIARGYSPEEARRQARLELGGAEQAKEQCRDARGTRWLEDLAQDAHYAMRTLRQKPGFVAVALLTLSLGVGATTVMFTVVNGVLLKPVPYAQPDRLVSVTGQTPRLSGAQNIAYYDFLDCARENRFLDMSGWLYTWGTVSEPGEPGHVELREVTANLFSVLGATHFQGRGFLPEEDRSGGTPVAVLSHDYWQRKFGGNPGTIGTTIVLDGKRYTVVGVAPAGFQLDGDDVYTPLGQDPAGYLHDRRPHPVGVISRLRPGATLAQAQGELTAIGRHLAAQYPDTNKDRSFVVQPLRPDVGDVGPTLWLLLGAVSLVLLIACVNVASLLLARAVARERELAMRVALGAGRLRLVRQCLTESAVLGLAGGVLGVVLAAVGIRPFLAIWPGSLPRAEEVHVDWRVLLFAVAASLLCGLLFGLAPALRAPVRNIEQILRAGSRTVGGSSRHLHGGFVVSEIALAVVLLVAAGVFGNTMLHLSALEPGFQVHNVLVARMGLSPSVLPNPAQTRAVWDDVVDRARHVPGVESVALVDTVPMRQGYNHLGYWTTAALPPVNQMPDALATSVTPDYLKVMGIPLRQGRFFGDQDRMGSQAVVVIDKVLAQHAFGGEPAVGKRLWIPDMGPGSFEVVGVVGHVRHWGLAGDDQSSVTRAQFYYPWAQVPGPLVRRWSELMSIAVRTTTPPMTELAPLRRELRGVTGDQVLYEPRTMEQLARASLDRQRFLMLLFGIFAGLALLLASIGLYGVLAYLISQRVPEFGVRIALGASGVDVIRLVLRESLTMLAAGIGLGITASLAAGRLLARLVDGVQPTGLSTLALMTSILVAAALVASFVPARRASRIDPMRALRQ